MKDWRTSCTRNRRAARSCGALAALTLLLALLSLCLGAEAVPPGQVVLAVLGRNGGTAAFRIVRYVRLPRLCACLLSGGALAVSGAIIQGVLSNALASPGTIGVNAGAGLAVAVCCAAAPAAPRLAPLAAMAGAFLGVMTVLGIARKTGASKLTLVLAGVAVSAIFSAGIDAVVTLVPEALNGYSDFRIGGFSGVTMGRIRPALWPALAGFLAALGLHNELDVLLLGREQARSLGLPAEKLEVLLLGLAAVLAGAAVSVGGLVGFVGLIVPHMMRRAVGEESGPLLLSCALGGAALLCGCDLLGRVLFAPFELPAGILTALTGGPFFLYIQRERGRLRG